jgi:ankyrin repeat protein
VPSYNPTAPVLVTADVFPQYSVSVCNSRFLFAAIRGDLEAIRFWLAQGVDVNCVCPKTERTALSYSIERGHIECLRYLLAWRDITIPDDLLQMALFTQLKFSQAILDYVLQSGKATFPTGFERCRDTSVKLPIEDIGNEDGHGYTLLEYAIAFNSQDAVTAFFASDQVFYVDDKKSLHVTELAQSAIQYAARLKRSEILKKFLARLKSEAARADRFFNPSNAIISRIIGETKLLEYAVIGGADMVKFIEDELPGSKLKMSKDGFIAAARLDAVEIFKNRKQDYAGIEYSDCKQVILEAVYFDSMFVIEYFTHNSINSIWSIKDSAGKPLAKIVAENGNLKLTEIYMKYVKDIVNSRKLMFRENKTGLLSGFMDQYMLVPAIINGHIHIVELILQNYKITKLQTKVNFVCYAAKAGHTDIVKYLVETHKFPVQTEKQSALICAAQAGHGSIVAFLADRYADLELTDKDGKNVLTYAQEAEHKAIADFLSGRLEHHSSVELGMAR